MNLGLIHRRANDLLTILVLIAGIYLIAAPFLPAIGWQIKPPTKSVAAVKASKPVQSGEAIPDTALLKIPRLGMNQEIHTGKYLSELNKGVWLIPNTSTPDKQSNTVMAGHRFTYAGPAVFYFLDKVRVGDKIYVDWQQKEYSYQVKQIAVVPPSATEIQKATAKPTLTLYTCTPLVTAKNRLVVISELTGIRS